MKICKKCGHKATERDLEIAEDTGFFPQETDAQRDRHINCGCYNQGDGDGCNCKFE